MIFAATITSLITFLLGIFVGSSAKSTRKYFYFTYQHQTGYGCGYTQTKNYPSNRELINGIVKNDPTTKDIVITNIIEFKNEQDYNDFVK